MLRDTKLPIGPSLDKATWLRVCRDGLKLAISRSKGNLAKSCLFLIEDGND